MWLFENGKLPLKAESSYRCQRQDLADYGP